MAPKAVTPVLVDIPTPTTTFDVRDYAKLAENYENCRNEIIEAMIRDTDVSFTFTIDGKEIIVPVTPGKDPTSNAAYTIRITDGETNLDLVGEKYQNWFRGIVTTIGARFETDDDQLPKLIRGAESLHTDGMYPDLVKDEVENVKVGFHPFLDAFYTLATYTGGYSKKAKAAIAVMVIMFFEGPRLLQVYKLHKELLADINATKLLGENNKYLIGDWCDKSKTIYEESSSTKKIVITDETPQNVKEAAEALRIMCRSQWDKLREKQEAEAGSSKRGRWRGPDGLDGQLGGRGPGGPGRRGSGGGSKQRPCGRGEGGGRGSAYQQRGVSGGSQGRGGGEVHARPAAPVVAQVVPAAASVSARPPPPTAAASSSSAPAPPPAASSALVVADPAPRAPTPRPRAPAPAATSGAHAPAAESEAEAAAYQQRQAPPVSSKGIAHPARPGVGTMRKKVVVRANHEIVHYDVSINPEPKAKSTNRELLSDLVKAQAATSLGRKTPPYDGRKSLYTAGKLPFRSINFVVKLGKERREIEYKITIQHVGNANLYHMQEFLHGRQRNSPQDTIQALDVVLRESPSLKSFFSKAFGRSDIGEGLECWRGYYQSLCPAQLGLSLNIDISSTAFYKSIPVIEFVQNLVQGINARQPIADRDRLKRKKALRGVWVETTHVKRSVYKITGINSVPLAQLNFSPNEDGQMTVVQYFASGYKYHLQYTAWTCLQSGNYSKPIYLPMEVCQIIEGQKYPKKLSGQQVTQILRATCEHPQDRENSILQIVSHNYSADRLAQVFGIHVVNKMAEVEARVLPPTMLKYHESGREKTCAPSFGQWNMFNKKMVNGGNVRRWTCLNFSRWQTDKARGLCGDLAQKCNSMGMVFNQTPVKEICSASPNQIEAALRDVHMRAPNLNLLIVILPEVTGHYGTIKRLCETELGIVSQCINTTKSKISNRYFENVALKINVKVGGCNTVLEEAVQNILPFVSDTPTIIFGADVTHHAAGEDSSASIAAVVASMDLEVTTYKALVSAQAHRQEIIQDLFWTGTDPEKGMPVNGGMIRELLSFYQKSRRKPGRIIFYRDGVSEGKFSHVLPHEMDAIKKACASIQEGYLPNVTFVIVQKRHRTRLLPENHGRRNLIDRSGTILPGTVVHTSICHPSEFDFNLYSHAGIKDVSKYRRTKYPKKLSGQQVTQILRATCERPQKTIGS